jgi:CrcB protein
MKQMLIVGLGGFLGAAARYQLGGMVLHHWYNWRFPLGTFVVNVLGCLFTGVLAGLVEKHSLFSLETRLFLFTGLAGGFTTFSAFGLETVTLLRRGHTEVAASYVALSVVCGIAALWTGMASARIGQG